MDDRRRRVMLVRVLLWGAVLLAALAFLLVQSRPPVGPAPSPATADFAASIGGPFSLVDRNGKTVTNRDLDGAPFAIFFGYTRCPDVCPTTLARLAKWKKALGADGDKLKIVFVSLDPEHDSPADIGAYTDLFGVPITGLTGSAAELAGIVKAYHVFYEKVPQPGGDFTIDHTATVFLMDGHGKLASTIDMAEGDEAAMAKLRALLA